MINEEKSEYDLVDEFLGQSVLLKNHGYDSRRRELEWDRYRYHVLTGPWRCLTICCYRLPESNHLFTMELFDTITEESFLIEDYTRGRRNPQDPYPFLLSNYPGDIEEKLRSFVAFIDTLLGDVELVRIMKGLSWVEINPSDEFNSSIRLI